MQGGGETLVTQLFDIWSMGCILSEAATWVILGHRGVELFRLVRKSEKSQQTASGIELNFDDQCSVSTDRSDTNTSDKTDNEEIRGPEHFHDGTKISDAVREWHTYLRHSLRTSDPVTNKILELVENHMLQGSPKHRADAVTLANLIKSIISTAKNASKSTPIPTGYKPPSYFKKAIRLEQGTAAEAIQRHLIEKGSEQWRDKYKSRAFIDAMKEPVGTSDEDFIEQFDKQISLEQEQDQVRGRSLHRISTAPPHYPLGSHNMFFSQASLREVPKTKTPPVGEYADYRQAREILEKAGWISGTLELPEGPSTPSLTSTQSPGSENTGISSWISSSTPSITPASEKSKHRHSTMSLIKQKINTAMTQKRRSLGSPPLSAASFSAGTPHRPGPTTVQQSQKSRSNQDHAISEDHKDKKINSYFENRDIVGSQLLRFGVLKINTRIGIPSRQRVQYGQALDLGSRTSRGPSGISIWSR